MFDGVAKKEASLREKLAEWKKSGVSEMQTLAVNTENAMSFSLAYRVVVRLGLSALPAASSESTATSTPMANALRATFKDFLSVTAEWSMAISGIPSVPMLRSDLSRRTIDDEQRR